MPLLSLRRALVPAAAAAALVLGGLVANAAPAEAAPTRTWDRLAQCEASGDWHIDTGNGYYGGLQFSMGTWRAHGGSGNPARASKAGQIRIAEKVLRSQGWGAWPACSSRLGLRGAAAAAPAAHRAEHRAAPRRARVATSDRTVVVRPGDTLVRLAQRARVRGGWQRLAAANPQLRDPDVLRVGQRLRLPA
ncbi:transglycosylase family protein [Amnibacterium kyonggiense]